MLPFWIVPWVTVRMVPFLMTVSCGTGFGDICAAALRPNKVASAVTHDDSSFVRIEKLLLIKKWDGAGKI